MKWKSSKLIMIIVSLFCVLTIFRFSFNFSNRNQLTRILLTNDENDAQDNGDDAGVYLKSIELGKKLENRLREMTPKDRLTLRKYGDFIQMLYNEDDVPIELPETQHPLLYAFKTIYLDIEKNKDKALLQSDYLFQLRLVLKYGINANAFSIIFQSIWVLQTKGVVSVDHVVNFIDQVDPPEITPDSDH